MTSLCIAVAAAVVAILPADRLTVSWLHSVERVTWEEDWRALPGGLALIEARVKGSGAGMEPGAAAVLENGSWRYRPDLPPQARLVLARSTFTDDYTLCWNDRCERLDGLIPSAAPAAPAEIYPCPPG